ncbi:unnamed protein product [Paramecium primaurelia]|uniref:Peptidase M12A domain-containing protein n=1 Tax=Paramecium primaurelia TaxID=5886 RepID=A0A8S1NPD6_PARPR|nr:unnamed protein product [Paramecium primaurelia]
MLQLININNTESIVKISKKNSQPNSSLEENYVRYCLVTEDYLKGFESQYKQPKQINSGYQQQQPFQQQSNYSGNYPSQSNQIYQQQQPLQQHRIQQQLFYQPPIQYYPPYQQDNYPLQQSRSQLQNYQNNNQKLQSLTFADWVWQKAINEFEQKTPIRFVKIRNPREYNQYVKYYKSRNNQSYVLWIGRSLSRKEHPVYIDDKFPYGTYLHETMYILGFKHEQCRQDRDNYVSVQFSEKNSLNLKYQYEKKGFMKSDYDPQSILHYYLNKNMISKSEYKNYQFGQRSQLSEGDINAIQLVYGKSQCTFEDLIINRSTFQDLLKTILIQTQNRLFRSVKKKIQKG